MVELVVVLPRHERRWLRCPLDEHLGDFSGTTLEVAVTEHFLRNRRRSVWGHGLGQLVWHLGAWGKSSAKMGHMDDGVDAVVWRQSQLVRDVAHALKNLKGANVLEGEFMVSAFGDGHLYVRLKLDEDPIADINGPL